MRRTKYPILLVHGMGFRDWKRINYWGRIPKMLEKAGNAIYYGKQDANATIETNARVLAEEIKRILEKEHAEKINVIAHSKGGLDIRYAISEYKLSDYIASFTTISTPHNGSKTIDKLLKIPRWLLRAGCKVFDLWMRLIGDKEPATYEVIKSFSTEFAKSFDQENDYSAIYCQSYGFVMSSNFSDGFMFLQHLFVKMIEGENDGLLTPDAVRWKNYRGTFTGSGRRGISHCDEIDMRRHRLSRKVPKAKYEISDMAEFYMDLVEELAEKGF